MERRFVEIDALKVAGIATVILIHCVRPQWDPSISPFEFWIGHWTRFGVPAFLLASGFLYAGGGRTRWRDTPRRLRRILLPYLFASVLAQLWWAARGEATVTGSLWRDLLFGASMGPYYYVFVITGLVLVTPLVARLSRPLLTAATLALIAAQWWVDAALGLPFDAFWHIRDPLLWWAYFFVGWQLRLHHDGVSAWISARRPPLLAGLALAVAVLGALSASDAGILAVRSAAWLNVYAIGALILTATCGARNAPLWLRTASDATYAVYLLHLFFVLSAQQLVPLPPLRAAFAPIALPWIAGVLGPAVVIAALQRVLGRRSRDVIGV